MNFEKWLENYNSSFADTMANHARYRGGLQLSKDKTSILIPEKLEEKAIQLYSTYRIEKTNKSLILATWFLAIATIVLSVITLILN